MSSSAVLLGMVQEAVAVGSAVLGLPLLVVVVSFSLLLLSKLGIALSDSNRSIPGPFFARFTRLWLLFQYRTGRYREIQHNLHKRYGPIWRQAPGLYSVNSPEAIRLLYSHGAKYPKADIYKPWGNPQYSNLFNTTDISHHTALRRKLTGVYSLSALKSYESCVDTCTALYTERLGEIADSGAVANVHHWNQCYAFDLITLITWSRRLGFLDRGEDELKLMEALEADQWYLVQIGLWNRLHPYLQPILVRLGLPGGRSPRAGHLFTRVNFDRKKRSPGTDAIEGQPQDFVDKLISVKDAVHSLSDTDILVAAGQNMGAGSDTTGITLSVIIYHLCKQPLVLSRLRAEILDKREKGELGEPITFDQAMQMRYLQAVIRESLRIHPAISWGYPRVVTGKGATIDGHHFAAGTILETNPYAYHRNVDVYGEDASDFIPERWLKEGGRAYSEIDFLTFGQGSRTCIGRNISMLEINKLIPQLVERFDFELVHGGRDWTVQTFSFAKPTDFYCKIHKRAKSLA